MVYRYRTELISRAQYQKDDEGYHGLSKRILCGPLLRVST